MPNKDEILDHKMSILDNGIDLEIKLVRGFSLAYLFYGLFYWLEGETFLVPLPIVYSLIPIIGIIMFAKNYKDVFSPILLIIPFIVIKDIWIEKEPQIIIPILIFAIASWIFWGSSFFWFSKNKSLPFATAMGISQCLIILLSVELPSEILIIYTLGLLIITTLFIRKNFEVEKNFPTVRIALLIQLIAILNLLQTISVWYN